MLLMILLLSIIDIHIHVEAGYADLQYFLSGADVMSYTRAFLLIKLYSEKSVFYGLMQKGGTIFKKIIRKL